MYETQFGLTKRPFRALPTGGDVFVGPQTAAAMAGLKKALATPDAIVSVTGPVGVGKTTTVRRALEAIGNNQVIVTVGRMQLGHDEVLELLLEELGVEMPAGTVQRFATFRRTLLQYAEDDTRVFIVVEDAARIGADALSELEALTASDAGVSEGANVVLMGDSGAQEALQSPQLARMRQRLRLRQEIAPLSASELLGYFKHCFRLAGAEFDTVFEGGAAEVLHRLSEGIPRVANNLVESSLISAVENKLDRVNVAQIKLVANEEYGLRINSDSVATPQPAPIPAPQPELEPQLQTAAEPEPNPEPEFEPLPVVELQPEPAEPPPAEIEKNDVPELIQDTQHDIEALEKDLAAPEYPEPDLESAQVEPADEAVPDWERDPTLAQLRPDLDALEHAMAVAQGHEAEEKQAQAKPPAEEESFPEITLDREIQAKIEQAEEHLKEEEARRAEREAREKEESGIDDRPVAEILAEARAKKAERKENPDNSVESQFENATFMPATDESNPAEQSASAESKPPADSMADLPVLKDMTTPSFEPAAHKAPEVAEAPQDIPELALEDEHLPEPMPEPEPEPDPEELAKAHKADAELEQIATNLAQARTIDDCDDKMAETLFGEEFSIMAAEVAAKAPAGLSANDDDGDASEAEADAPAAGVPDFDGAAALSVELETRSNGLTAAHMDSSASQRLATVRALNGGPESMPEPEPELEPEPVASPSAPAPAEQPQSIEDQINTSMTQTLKALGAHSPEDVIHDEDDDDEPRRGFFSRFKRS